MEKGSKDKRQRQIGKIAKDPSKRWRTIRKVGKLKSWSWPMNDLIHKGQNF